jgi:hypothetical protein
MGRHELVHKIAAQRPHLDRRDVEAIVETVIEALKDGKLEDVGFDAGLSQRPATTEGDHRQSDEMARLLDLISQLPDEALDQPMEAADTELVRSVFEAVFESVARSADMLDEGVDENRRYRDEFERRSREIDALQRDIDARLQRLVG